MHLTHDPLTDYACFLPDGVDFLPGVLNLEVQFVTPFGNLHVLNFCVQCRFLCLLGNGSRAQQRKGCHREDN